MNSHDGKILDVDLGPQLTPAVKNAIALLLQARETASKLGYGSWDFALEIQALREADLNHNDLRFLICQGFAEHRVERTRRGAKRRTFGQPPGMRLASRSCFALVEASLSLAREIVAHDRHVPTNGCRRSNGVSRNDLVPFWDSDRRELRVGDVVAKCFRQPAKNQEAILAAFQEDGWPPRIDNPLSGNASTDAQERLHDTVKKLNHQTKLVLRFLSDGSGQGVLWKFAAMSDLRAT